MLITFLFPIKKIYLHLILHTSNLMLSILSYDPLSPKEGNRRFEFSNFTERMVLWVIQNAIASITLFVIRFSSCEFGIGIRYTFVPQKAQHLPLNMCQIEISI